MLCRSLCKRDFSTVKTLNGIVGMFIRMPGSLFPHRIFSPARSQISTMQISRKKCSLAHRDQKLPRPEGPPFQLGELLVSLQGELRTHFNRGRLTAAHKFALKVSLSLFVSLVLTPAINMRPSWELDWHYISRQPHTRKSGATHSRFRQERNNSGLSEAETSVRFNHPALLIKSAFSRL